jgi:tRNA dimethylallyltransferase
MKPRLIVITGPTACGKTALSLALAQALQAPIINADSRQFYKGMDIGTAKVSPEEQRLAPHYFLDFLEVWQEYSVGDYEKEVLTWLDKHFQSHSTALLVGGSGLFIRAVCQGMDVFPEVDPSLRPRLQAQLEAEGITALQAQLAQLDPVYYAEVDRQNPHRLIRALEVCLSSGQAFSSFRSQAKIERPFDVHKFALHWERETLYQRINQRVDQMVEMGLEEEVRKLYAHRHCNALQTVGYREWFPYFEGLEQRSTCIERIKQHSRNYAKRQITWFNKEPHLHWLAPEQALELILEHLSKS